MEALAIPIVFITIFLESILSGRWKDIYFKYGIPLFVKKFNYESAGVDIGVLEQELNNKFTSSGIGNSLIFKNMKTKELAFREKYFEFSLLNYTPVMHGKISVSDHAKKVKVTGYANWFPIAFFYLWYGSIIKSDLASKDTLFLIGPIIVFSIIYLIQVKKYITVCNYIKNKKY